MKNLLLATALLALALPIAAGAAQAGGVSGYVYDSRTHAPMAGTNVMVLNWTTGTAASVRTDRNGFFVDLTGGQGAYLVVVQGQLKSGTHELYEGCAVGDSRGLNSARVNVNVQWNVRFGCDAPRAGLVSSSQTADMYVVPSAP